MKKTLLLEKIHNKTSHKICLLLMFFMSTFIHGQTITPIKTVTVNPNSCDIIDVELKIVGADPMTRPLEVVLVIDVSGSMGYSINGDTNTSMDYAKNAAIDFINNIFLPANNPTGLNKVAIVSFSSTATIRQGLTLSAGKVGLISIINNLIANGATNNQDAIVKADNVLTNQGTFNCVTSRNIILLTDGVTNRTGTNGSGCTSGINGSCVQSTIVAATNAKTTTVSGTVYQNQIFTIGLFGGISGTNQTIAEYTLNNVQSSGAFFTESGANLSGIYSQIFTQLAWVAMQLTSTPFVTETIYANFDIVPASIVISNGSYSLTGQLIHWNLPFLNAETVSLKYQLTPKQNICSNQIVSATQIDYLDSSCNISRQNIIAPSYCVPCPPIVTKGSIGTCYNNVAEAEAAALLATTATNNCSQSLTKTASTTGTCTAVITVTVTNSCGYSNFVTYNTKIDATPPIWTTLPNVLNVTLECNDATGLDNAQLLEPNATDNCGNYTLTKTSGNFQVGSCTGTGTYTNKWIATDECGNISAEYVQTITVQDTTAPTFVQTIPTDVTVECNAIPSVPTITATDICDTNPISVVFTETTSAGNCPSNYTLTRTWTATDACGNVATASQTITVQDTTAPIFVQTIPNDVTVECNAIPSVPTITATDTCDTNPISVVFTETTSAGNCPSNYTLTRTWTATDSCGNVATASQTITVQDTTAPTLNGPLDTIITVNCSDIPVIPTLDFVDNCSATVDVFFDEELTTISATEYIITRDWLVTDLCGNSELFTQTINVTVNITPTEFIPFDICTLDLPVDLFTLLNASTPSNGQWIDLSNSGGLSGSTLDPTNLAIGNYIFHYIVTNTAGNCPSIYEINVNVNDDCIVLPACDIVIYNAVSPNNDGLNEFLFIDGLECYPENTVEIYNRWGILVYETNGYNNSNKSFKGYSEGRTTVAKNELLPDGTYYYILKYNNIENNTFDKTGYLYLNR